MIELLPVKPQGFPAILQLTIQGFADECVEAGRWAATEAYAHSKKFNRERFARRFEYPRKFIFSSDINI